MLERLFRLRENGTTLRTEIVTGVTTFLTMSYITFVQPAVLSGVLLLVLSLVGAREAVMSSISPSMKHAITAGIGLFIAFIGLQNAGLIVKDPGTAVRLNPQFASPDLLGYFVFVRSRL